MRGEYFLYVLLILLEICHFSTAVAQTAEEGVKEEGAEQKSSNLPDTSGADTITKVEGNSIKDSEPPAAVGEGLLPQQLSNNQDVKSASETTDENNNNNIGGGAETSSKDSTGGDAVDKSKSTDTGSIPDTQERLGTKVSVDEDKPESKFSPFIILLPRRMFTRQQRQTTDPKARLFLPNVIRNMFQGIFGERNLS